MDVLQAIRERRSIRKYLDTPVEDEKIQAILEAGRWAPSASNRQPWHFIVIRDAETRRRLAEAHPYGRFMAESPVVIVVLAIPARHQKYHLCDPHNAMQNMLLAAYALGLGTCWVGVRNTPMENRFREILGVPRGLRVVCAFPVGYPAETAESSREPLEKIVSYERYGG